MARLTCPGAVEVLKDRRRHHHRQGEREEDSGQQGGCGGAGQGGQVAQVTHLQPVLCLSGHQSPVGPGRKLASACSMEIEMLKHLAASYGLTVSMIFHQYSSTDPLSDILVGC